MKLTLLLDLQIYFFQKRKDFFSTCYLPSLQAGMYAHPVYSKEGGWPPIVEELLAKKSKKEGFSQSRLPAFTEEEKEFVKGKIKLSITGIDFYN